MAGNRLLIVDGRALVDLTDAVATFQPTVILAGLNIAGGRDSDLLARLAESGTTARLVIRSAASYRRAAGIVADHIGLNVVGSLDKPLDLHEVRSLLGPLKIAEATGRATQTDAGTDDRPD